jgi:hypothetical protein
VVDGLVGDEAGVGAEDEGVLFGVVIAAGGRVLDLSREFGHEGGALWEGDAAACGEDLVELGGDSLGAEEGY